jgi:anti-sigma factor RsiW
MNECPECRAEIERFTKGLALFRRVVRDLVDDPVTLQEADFMTLAPVATGVQRWRWTLAAAGLVAAILLPFFITFPKSAVKAPAEMSPEVVMERLNRHLARTLPEPMEPMMSLISSEQPASERKGVQ